MVLSLLLALALPVLAAVAPVRAPELSVLVPALPASTVVPPVLLGPISDPGSPIARSLDFHAARLEEGSGEQAAYLSRLRTQEPMDRVASSVFARALTDPGSRARLIELSGGEASIIGRFLKKASGGEGLAALAEASRADPELQSLFDGSQALPIAAEGLQIRRGHLASQGTRLEPLGRGGFGVVYPHPSAEGVVLKLTDLTLDVLFAALDGPQAAADKDAAATAHLAAHALGPRLLARAVVQGRLVAYKERVYGETVQDLIDSRRYGPAEHALVMNLLERMADSRVRVADMNPANLIMGRTLVDPRLRVYHIDGGEPGVVAPSESRESLRESLETQTALFKFRMDRYMGMIETTINLRHMLEEGLKKSSERTRWERFKGGLKRAFFDSYFPAK